VFTAEEPQFERERANERTGGAKTMIVYETDSGNHHKKPLPIIRTDRAQAGTQFSRNEKE
jgi:hypothetical protein